MAPLRIEESRLAVACNLHGAHARFVRGCDAGDGGHDLDVGGGVGRVEFLGVLWRGLVVDGAVNVKHGGIGVVSGRYRIRIRSLPVASPTRSIMYPFASIGFEREGRDASPVLRAFSFAFGKSCCCWRDGVSLLRGARSWVRVHTIAGPQHFSASLLEPQTHFWGGDAILGGVRLVRGWDCG